MYLIIKTYTKDLLVAIIHERYLFSWKDFQHDLQTLGDLERFQLVIDTIPDQKLIVMLQRLRNRGRDDHPIASMWNSILAGIVFEHPSMESLRRELSRNAQLRDMCGFNPITGSKSVPSKSAYSRFLAKLVAQESLVRDMFQDLVNELKQLIPKLGTNIAGDGKIIASLGKPPKKIDGDKRREEDADWGKKTYRGVDKDGKAWEKVKSWFGFRLHLVVDADAELPLAYSVTKASVAEQPEMRKVLAALKENQPELLNQCEHAMLDKGYDSKETICFLWEKLQIKPIIDIRNMWKDGEGTRAIRHKKIKNVTYDFKGTIFCHCPETGEVRRMSYSGFEEHRATLKYICPALAYGIACKGAKQCSLYNKSLRIPLQADNTIELVRKGLTK